LIWKESNDKTINRIKSNITISASRYIDHAENKVLKLQEAYLRKYQSQQYAYPANVSQRPKDVPNKRLGSCVPTLSRGQREDRREPELTKAASSEEGISNVAHGHPTWFTKQVICISVRR
jgi:hypothetical protein